ncbi:MAG: GspH/FimT family pseudopilin [Burkholderiales bacterium]
MPTSARGTCRSARAAPGFTLIEMLVVLLIMGLMVGMASAIVRPDDRARVCFEADRLAQLLDLAATEARLTGWSVAWTPDARGYRFRRMTADAQWLELRDSDALRPRTLPQGMQITAMQVENVPVTGDMRLEFTPQGRVFAFRIELTLGAARCAVAATPLGEVRVSSDDEAADVTPLAQ